MPFGEVSGVDQGTDVLYGVGDRRRGRSSFGVNLRHPVVTCEVFVA